MNISIVVCTYNRGESVRDTVRAIKMQSIHSGVQIELIVVDNNSKDRTSELILNEITGAPFPIRYVFEGKQGLCVARNRGIRESQGEMVLFTDDDTLPEPSWAMVMWEAFHGHDADCLGGKILPYWLKEPPIWLKNNKVFLGNLAMLDNGNELLIAKSYDANFMYGANMAYRRSCFDEIGLFDERIGAVGSLILRGDDSDMLKRFVEANKRVMYIPDSIVHHKVEPNRVEKKYFRTLRYQSGRTYVQMNQAKELPLWLVKECIQYAIKALLHYLRNDQINGTKNEMIFWFQLGQIFEVSRNKIKKK